VVVPPELAVPPIAPGVEPAPAASGLDIESGDMVESVVDVVPVVVEPVPVCEPVEPRWLLRVERLWVVLVELPPVVPVDMAPVPL
jgi:hypothetical protein